jgi:hypothetical protein
LRATPWKIFKAGLVLQLRFLFDMGFLSGGLVGASPEAPCDGFGGLDLSLGEFCGDAADFLKRPADQRDDFLLAVVIVFGGGAALA